MRWPTPIALAVGCVLLVAGTASLSAAQPPRPGTTDSGLNESEEATLWSNVPAGRWEPRPEEETAIHEIATGTDLTFTEPPDTARRWNEYGHAQFDPGDRDTSVHPESVQTHSYSYIEDAYVAVFSVTPSTRAYVAPDKHRRYVAPAGRIRGTVDYRIDLPDDTDSRSWRLLDDDVETVRLAIDGEQVASAPGTHSPVFEYNLDSDAETLRLEARIEATIEETYDPPASSQPSNTETYDVWMEVWYELPIEVYDFDATVSRVEYPDGDSGLSITQPQPWQGYTLDGDGDEEIRGIWRFFTARTPNWQTVVASTESGTTRRKTEAYPASVYAYPSRLSPRAKPEHTEPTILRSWGPTHESPASLLPGNVAVEIVEGSYTETSGIAVRTDDVDPDAFEVQGIVHGTEMDARTLFSEPRTIRETELSASITDSSETGATVRVELEDAETGAPIELGTDETPAGRPRSGHILIGEKRVWTDANGQATVHLSEPGAYTVRYEPASWLDTAPAYAGDTASIRWHPLTTPAGWIAAGLRIGLFALPFAVAWYAGRHLAAIFRLGGGRSR
jgi:hypothetical protein